MAEIHCKSCKFFQGNALGVCLRYPEQVGKAETSWCGEFVAKKQQAEMLELPVVEMQQSEPKRRGRPKKGENDVQTSA